jgi:hypothetical protein
METITLTALLWRAATVIVLVAANAFFVAAEFALVAARRTRLDSMARRGDAKAKLAFKATQSLDRYISGTQLGITVASLGLGWIGEPAVAGAIGAAFHGLPTPFNVVATHTVAGVIAFMLITFLHIVLGELAPKALALLYPEATSRWVAAPLILFTEATNPFIWLLNGSANGLLRLFGIRAPGEAERVHQPEEILMLVRQSQRAGSLEREDVRMRGIRVHRKERARRDDATHRRGGTRRRRDGGAGRPADQGGRPLTLPDLRRDPGRRPRHRAHQGHSRRDARAGARTDHEHRPRPVLRARHARGRGRPRRHEAPQGTDGGGAR